MSYLEGGADSLLVFFSLCVLVFFSLCVFVVLDAGALESCANTGAAKPNASAAVKSSVKSFFIRVATSLGLYFAQGDSKANTRLTPIPVNPVINSYHVVYHRP